eukprot:jgi/Tetstr1/449083/TSEL_036296.t2
MPDGEEPVAEPTLESLQAYVRALATAVAQLTARERVVDGEGAHGSGFGQRIAGQPTGSGGAAERPDLLELAQSGRVGAKSVSAEDDYLAVPELLQRVESGGVFVDVVFRGPHAMAALFVALDELLPYVPATNHDFTPYLARARNHAEAIEKAFRFRLAFLRRLNEIKRVHATRRRPLLLEWRLQLQVAGAGEDEAVDAGVAAKDAFGLDELGQRTLDLLSSSLSAQTLKSFAGRLSQFAEFCHDSENISPLEATTATVVRYVTWIGERGHIAAKSLQPYLSAINTFFELHNLDPIAKDSLHLTSARRGLMLRQRRLDAAPLRIPLPADVAYRFVTKAELIVSAPYPEYHHDFRALLASVINFMFFARGLTGVSCRALWPLEKGERGVRCGCQSAAMASPGLMAAVVARYLSEHGFAAASAAFDLEAAPLLSRWETEAGAPGGGRLVAKALSELLAEYAELWGRESRRHALCAANPALTPMLAAGGSGTPAARPFVSTAASQAAQACFTQQLAALENRPPIGARPPANDLDAAGPDREPGAALSLRTKGTTSGQQPAAPTQAGSLGGQPAWGSDSAWRAAPPSAAPGQQPPRPTLPHLGTAGSGSRPHQAAAPPAAEPSGNAGGGQARKRAETAGPQPDSRGGKAAKRDAAGAGDGAVAGVLAAPRRPLQVSMDQAEAFLATLKYGSGKKGAAPGPGSGGC